jgi:hypothetical protein
MGYELGTTGYCMLYNIEEVPGGMNQLQTQLPVGHMGLYRAAVCERSSVESENE